MTIVPTLNKSRPIFDTFATVAPDVEPTLRTSVRDTFAIACTAPVRGYHISETCKLTVTISRSKN